MTKTRSQIGRGSKNKGKWGEREVVQLLQAFGFKARRGQQYAGGGDSPDVIHNMQLSDDRAIHIEVKRAEKFLLWSSLDQAREDASPGDIPVVFYRKSRKPWVVVLTAVAFLTIMKTSASGVAFL